MRFIVDAMLGKLARWLRMLGQDVSYSVQFADNDLLCSSKTEKRALLTRDLELYKRAISRGLEAFYVEGKTEANRLAEVAKLYGLTLEIDMNKSHCPACNTPIKAASKEQLRDKLKPNTYTYYDKFWQCPKCGQVYWQGAHWKQIIETLKRAQEKNFRDQYEQMRKDLDRQ